MMQGDSYNLGFTVRNNAGSVITPADVMDVEGKVIHGVRINESISKEVL